MAGRLLRELTIRQLRALAMVQKSRSVTAAAKQLHLTQPAVTLQLRNLQALAGLPLIQRTGDGMLLTDAGREVLALADRIEAAIADCETTLQMMTGKTAGRISIGAVSTAKYFVPFMISGFSKLYPNIDITLSIGNRQEIGMALRGYDLDFAENCFRLGRKLPIHIVLKQADQLGSPLLEPHFTVGDLPAIEHDERIGQPSLRGKFG